MQTLIFSSSPNLPSLRHLVARLSRWASAFFLFLLPLLGTACHHLLCQPGLLRAQRGLSAAMSEFLGYVKNTRSHTLRSIRSNHAPKALASLSSPRAISGMRLSHMMAQPRRLIHNSATLELFMKSIRTSQRSPWKMSVLSVQRDEEAE